MYFIVLKIKKIKNKNFEFNDRKKNASVQESLF